MTTSLDTPKKVVKPLNELTLVPMEDVIHKNSNTESFLYTYSLSFLAASCSEFGKHNLLILITSNFILLWLMRLN